MKYMAPVVEAAVAAVKHQIQLLYWHRLYWVNLPLQMLPDLLQTLKHQLNWHLLNCILHLELANQPPSVSEH